MSNAVTEGSKRLLLASLLIQINIGSLYAWNIISTNLTEEFNYSAGIMGAVYGLMLITFTGSMIFIGKQLHKFSPRLVLLSSITLYTLGMLCTAFSHGNPLLVFLGHGLFAGLGTGLGYVSTTTYGLLPFQKKSIPLGLIVAAFGLGSVLVTNGIEHLQKLFNIQETLLIVVGIQAATMLPALFCVPKAPFQSIVPTKRKESAQRPPITPFVIAMFAATFGGLLVVSNMQQVVGPLNETISTSFALSLFAIGNGTSRIVTGLLQIKNNVKAIVISMLSALALLLILSVSSTPLLIHILIVAIGALFGSFFVLFPSLTLATYGQNNFAKVYPIIFFAYGVAALVSAPFGGFIFEKFNHPRISLISAAVVALFGAVILIVQTTKKRSQ